MASRALAGNGVRRMNPDLTATERVLWRGVAQAAHEAARDPASAARAKALKKSMAGWEGWRHPDLRPLPRACFRAFLYLAVGWANEPDTAVRAALAPRLAGMADAAGDILDGIRVDDGPRPAWTQRADIG